MFPIVRCFLGFFMFMVSTTPALEADVMRQIRSISAQEHMELSSL